MPLPRQLGRFSTVVKLRQLLGGYSPAKFVGASAGLAAEAGRLVATFAHCCDKAFWGAAAL